MFLLRDTTSGDRLYSIQLPGMRPGTNGEMPELQEPEHRIRMSRMRFYRPVIFFVLLWELVQ